MGVCVVSRSVVFNSLWPYGLQPTRLLCPWNSPVKNIGVGCHFLFQRIIPDQYSNPSFLLGKRFFTTEPAREAPPSSLLLTKYQMILLWLLSSSLEMDKIDKIFLIFVIQELSLVQPFVTPQTVAFQSSLYFTTSRTLLKFISLSQWCYLTSHALPPSSFAFNLS